MQKFKLDINSIKGSTSGLFVSPGHGRHSTRVYQRWNVLYVLNGTLHMFEENEHFDVPAGHALVIRPHVLHGGTQEYKSGLKFYWFHFYATESDNEDAIHIDQFSKVSRPERLKDLFYWYNKDIQDNRKNPYARDAMAKLILLELQDYSNKSFDKSHHLVENIKNYIYENIENKLSSSIIAGELNYNCDYIERVFKKQLNMTITQFIQLSRINHSTSLLAHSTMSISEIANLAGFSSKEDFYRVFKKIKHTSPSAYRKNKTSYKINNI